MPAHIVEKNKRFVSGKNPFLLDILGNTDIARLPEINAKLKLSLHQLRYLERESQQIKDDGIFVGDVISSDNSPEKKIKSALIEQPKGICGRIIEKMRKSYGKSLALTTFLVWIWHTRLESLTIVLFGLGLSILSSFIVIGEALIPTDLNSANIFHWISHMRQSFLVMQVRLSLNTTLYKRQLGYLRHSVPLYYSSLFHWAVSAETR